MIDSQNNLRSFWNALGADFLRGHSIEENSFHLGPLLPDAPILGLKLPQLRGLDCLELGCGAGHNSRFLAAQGASCTALDLSSEMLSFASAANPDIDWRCENMESVKLESESFDFIHSVLAFPFVEPQSELIESISSWLKPGGSFLLSTNHPAFNAEWIELEDHCEGMFSTSYLRPPREMRFAQNEQIAQPVFCYPPSDYFRWFQQAGLQIESFLEPRPQQINDFSEEALAAVTPYMTPLWRELYPRMLDFPLVQVYLVKKPLISSDLDPAELS